MNEVNITELLDSVVNSQNQKKKRKIENIRKRYEWLQKYSKDNNLTLVDRIQVIPRTSTVTVESEHRKVWRSGTKSIDCGKETREHVIKYKEVTDEDIVEAIKAIHPTHVTERLYWFNNTRYLFTTDCGQVYNLQSTPRPLSKEEQQQIDQHIADVLENKERIEPLLERARILVVHNIPQDKRTEEHNKLAESTKGEYMLYMLELEKEFTKERKRSVYCHNNRNIYGETPEEHVIQGVYNDAKKAKEEHLTLVEDTLTKIDNITRCCTEEPLYYIHPLKENKQIKVYIGKSSQHIYTNKGYTVYEVERERTTTKHNIEKGEIVEQENQFTKTSYYFLMNTKAFRSCCYQGKLCNKGFYYDNNGNEVKFTRRPTEEITLIDQNGITRTFASKSQAAKELDVALCTITKACKKGGVINTSNNANNMKSVKLLTEDFTLIQCSSLTELAKELNTNKMKVSRAIKGKQKGDTVTIDNRNFTILG